MNRNQLRGGATWGPQGEASAYRYRLWRNLELSITERPLRSVGFVMLNPSTATAELDDPTIRRCIGFARAWGFERMNVVNIFALRSTDPRALYGSDVIDAVGPMNDHAILETAHECEFLVAAWGCHGKLNGRGEAVRNLLAAHDLRVLRLTRGGFPAHPLYLPSALVPSPWPRMEAP